MTRKLINTLKQKLQVVGYVRWARAAMALLIFTSILIPVLSEINTINAYALTPEVEKVLGKANKNLSAKFSFDAANNTWQFNKDGAASLASSIAKQQGGDAEGVGAALAQLKAKQIGGGGKEDKSLYSADLSVDPKQGITYYDNQTNLSFKMVPNFPTREGKMVQDRIVYPFGDGGQIVYTAKTNGLKEDIVLSKYIGDTLNYGYTLQLPDSLEARALDDGSIGIYSADPSLFGNISFGSDVDQAKVLDARKNGTKNNMVFGIPAPFIKDQNGKDGHTKYVLEGNQLQVFVSDLKDLSYPLAVDPSVVITSSTQFQDGNNEGMIEFGTDQINRSGITGGTVESWANVSTTSNYAARTSSGVATYNGYVYVVGGFTNTNSGVVNYAKLGSNGTLSNNSCGTSVTWCTGPSITNVGDTAAVAYNGYLYAISREKVRDTVEYAKINSTNGSLGAWSNANTGASFTLRMGHTATVYNGYMYVLGGCGTGNLGQVCPELTTTGSTVYKADIRANGQLGAWSNANTGASFAARFNHASAAYNGYMYVLGGCNVRETAALTIGNCASTTNDVSFAKINSDGTLQAWSSLAAFADVRVLASAVVHNGYLYIMQGCENGNSGCQTSTFRNNVQYAPIYANGTIGSWSTTNTLAAGRYGQGAIISNNYMYMFGGCGSMATVNCGNHGGYLGTTVSAKVEAPGSISTYTQNSATLDGSPVNGGTGIYGAATVAYNGWLYMLGGHNGNFLNTVYRAQINADGSTGSWSTTASENFAHTRGAAAAVAYNGYMYIIGGSTDTVTADCTVQGTSTYCRDIQKAQINANGSLGTWSSAGGYYAGAGGPGRAQLGATTYNGYIYVMGGVYDNNTLLSTEIDIAPINADGTVGTWVQYPTGIHATVGRGSFGMATYGNHVYITGGRSSGGGTVNKDVIFATLGNGGTISAWQSAGPDFIDDRNTLSSVAHNGYLYIMGGNSNGGLGNVGLADTQYAKINADGTIGAWVTAPNLFGANRVLQSAAVYNGYLYVMGGCNSPGLFGNCNTFLNDVQYARINNGGGGAPTGQNTTASFTGNRFFHSTVAANGYLYVIGGCTAWSGATCTAAPATDYSYGQINPNGTITSWTQVTGALPTGVYNTASVVANGNIYLLGGCSSGTCSTYQNTVQKAQINANGSLTWGAAGTGGTFAGGMAARWGAAAATYNGYLYLLGGNNSGGSLNDVWKSQISSIGTLGAWQSAGAAFTNNRYLPSAIAHKGYLYVMGGVSAPGSNTPYNDVQYIPIAADGSITGSWSNTTSFSQGASAMNAAVYNGNIYLYGGGITNTSATNATRFAPVLPNGRLGSWTLVPGSSLARGGTGSTIHNGYIYVTGGWNTVSLTNTVDYAMVQTQSRIGRYSKLIEVQNAIDIASVWFNGSVGNGASVSYRVAPLSGIFTTTGTGSQGTGSEPTPKCGTSDIYYVQVTITLDDSGQASFADESTSNVTDITVYHRAHATPPPNQRLYGGKWFLGHIQQPHDMCRP